MGRDSLKEALYFNPVASEVADVILDWIKRNNIDLEDTKILDLIHPVNELFLATLGET